ncbi:MAG: BrnT family toxin [Actinomycetota bacterium]|nr:BrnT family toxin [Actinomycetota bacterium]
MNVFDFDERKSRLNHDKHGIDFFEAQELWLDDRCLEVRARSEGEPRYLIIGLIGEVHWSAIVTYRAGIIRLISVRRSRDEEVDLYEGE